MTSSFEDDGFALLPALVTAIELARIDAAMARPAGAGARDLLDEPWCATLAETSSTHLPHAAPRARRG